MPPDKPKANGKPDRKLDQISSQDEGFIRPEARVLAKEAIVPDKNLLFPPPNQVSHQLTQEEPFYFDGIDQQEAPSGHLPQGSKVMLLCYEGGDTCWVADEHGLYVQIAIDKLRKL